MSLVTTLIGISSPQQVLIFTYFWSIAYGFAFRAYMSIPGNMSVCTNIHVQGTGISFAF